MKKQLLFTGLLSLALFTGNGFAQKSNKHLLISAKLDGDQQVPTAIITPAVGVGGFMLNATRDTLCINVSVNGLSGSITGAHIHEGAMGTNGGVVVDLSTFVKGNRIVGSITGSTLTSVLLDKMLKGKHYINVHTAANPNGEIRGQLKLETDWGFSAMLDGAQQTPAVNTMASGLGVLKLSNDNSKLKIYIVAHGLSGAITGAHFHKEAKGKNGPVVLDLDAGIMGNVISLEVNPANYLTDLLAGKIYINLHTTANPNGEIRGQVMLDNYFVFDAKLDGMQQNPAVNVPAKGIASFKVNYAMDSLWYDAVMTGLSGVANGAHLHNGAKGTNGGVALDLTAGIMGNKISGVVTGAMLTKELINKIFSGDIYLNVHTVANPNGEIRGQVMRFARYGMGISLDGMQQMPPVTSTGTGAGIVSIDRDMTDVHYMVVVSGLKSKLAGAHFHTGLSSQSGPVTFDLSSAFSKTSTNDAAFGYLNSTDTRSFKAVDAIRFMKDSIYINLHNADFPNGEIRGQVKNGGECFNMPTGVEDENNLIASFEVAPNPTNGIANVNFVCEAAGNAKISVLDMMGREMLADVLNITSNSNSYQLNMSNMVNGVYMVKIQIGTKNLVKRVVKN